MRPRILSGVGLVVVLLLAVGCGGAGDSPEVIGDGGGRFPADTLEDWKSYADHVVVYSVVAENEVPPDPQEQERGEGMVGRTVNLRVEEILWSAQRGPDLPNEVSMRVAGWALEDGVRRRFRLHGSPRVELGQRFLAPLVRVEEPFVEWWPLSTSAVVPVVDGRIQTDDTLDNPVGKEFAGHAISALDESLARQDPDPLAAKHQELRPTERVEAVLAEGGFKDG